MHTGEVGLAAASDVDILNYARRENRVVVTLDADFHMLLALARAHSPSVVRIRIEGLSAAELVRVIQHVAVQCSEDLEHGAVVTVQINRLRVRRLPLA